MRYPLFFHINYLKSGLFYSYSTSQFGPAVFQVFGSHMWPVVTILQSTVLEIPINPKRKELLVFHG